MGILSLINFNYTNFGIKEIFISLITILIIYITNYYYKYYTRINPLPGPFPLPFIGNLYLFQINDFSRFLKKCHEKYGDLFEIYIGMERQICVGRLEVFEKFFNPSLKTNFKLRSLYKPGLDEFGVSGYGVVYNHDYNSWQFNRQFFTQVMLTPSFSQLSLTQTQNFLKEIINYWNIFDESNIKFDLRLWLFSFMTDTLMDLFIGKKGKSIENYYLELINKSSIRKEDEYVELLLKHVDGYVFHLFFGSFAKYFPILKSIAKKHIDNRDKYWDYIYKIIYDHKKFIEITPKDQLRDDMITLLLTANTDNDINISKSRVKDLNPEYQRPLNDKELLMNLSEAIGAGVDSIASLLTLLIYYLIKNPKTLKKLREEILSILGNDFNSINLGDLEKFKYLEALIKETARMSSITPLVDRYNYEAGEVAGYEWPANTHFIINASGTQSDPNYWKNPEIFDPERFLEPNNNHKALILFGGGIRICPGRKYSMILMKTLIASLVHKFDFELVNPNEPIKIRYAVFNQPSELYIRVKKREINP